MNSVSSSLLVLMLSCAAFFAGALVPFQASSNAVLGRSLGHPLWATVTSLFVSVIVILPVLAVMKVPEPSLNRVMQLPLWAWFGGIAGVIYITSALLITPRLGATTFIVSVIAGQMLTSLLIDHFGLMALPVKPANAGRIVGTVLMLIGMLVIQWSTATESQQQGKAGPHTSVLSSRNSG